MSSNHKDLPPGSQKWAAEVDRDRAELKELREVVRRLTENAGIDYANPKRGVNTGNTPSIKSPVGQKLSSLADVSTYNVLDGQGLVWNQQGQKWLPVTPVTGGTVDISGVSYSDMTEGYGVVTDSGQYAYTSAEFTPNPFGPDFYTVETWATGTTFIGTGNWSEGPGVALVTLDIDGFGRPSINLSAEDYVDGSSSNLEVYSFGIKINGDVFKPPVTTTAGRPIPAGLGMVGDPGCLSYDLDLGIPIWWDGAGNWRDALGTIV